jgi:hypothetical protein
MKAIHGDKAKNDKVDSYKIASLIRGGTFPMAFVYPRDMLLNSVPGIGKIISLVILYEIYDIKRFPTVQNFVSYARLIKCKAESAGKSYGTSGAKIGNAHSVGGLVLSLFPSCMPSLICGFHQSRYIGREKSQLILSVWRFPHVPCTIR